MRSRDDFKASKTRTPIAEANQSSHDGDDICDLVDAQLIRQVVDLDSGFPLSKDRSCPHNLVALYANGGSEPKPSIFPHFFQVFWPIVFNWPKAVRNYAGFSLLASFGLFGGVDKRRLYEFSRQAWDAVADVKRAEPFQLGKLFQVGISFDPLARNLAHFFHMVVQWVRQLPVVHEQGCNAAYPKFQVLVVHEIPLCVQC